MVNGSDKNFDKSSLLNASPQEIEESNNKICIDSI